jgi:hypothetical protein
MSRTYKDKPLRLLVPRNDEVPWFADVEHEAYWRMRKNQLVSHSRNVAKVRKHFKHEVTKERRRLWLSNREAKGSWKRINYQVWLY